MVLHNVRERRQAKQKLKELGSMRTGSFDFESHFLNFIG